MPRFRFLVLCLVLLVALFWVKPVVAEDPNPTTCLNKDGKCYASNEVTTPGDGTNGAPWQVTSAQDLKKVQNVITSTLDVGSYTGGSLAYVFCDTKGCKTTWYEYDEDGKPLEPKTVSGRPPEVGVPLPFSYILVGGVLLAVALIGAGIFLRRRARRLGVTA